MDIRTLRYVVTLAEELHFGRAARRHYVSAQPFGQHIQRAERELGSALFARTSRQVALTPAGERVVAHARQVLAQVDHLREVARDDGPPTVGPLRLGVLGFGAGDRWRALHEAVLAQLPSLVIEHYELHLADQYEAVRSADVDVALVQQAGEVGGLVFDPVLSSPRVAVVPIGSPWAAAATLTFEDLADGPWLEVVSQEPVMREWMGLAAGGRSAMVRHPAAIPTAVATTGRISFHAAAAAEFYPRADVRFVPVEGSDVQVAVASRENDTRPAVAAFRRAAQLVGCPKGG